MYKLRIHILNPFWFDENNKPGLSFDVDMTSKDSFDYEMSKIRMIGGIGLTDKLFIPMHNIRCFEKIEIEVPNVVN